MIDFLRITSIMQLWRGEWELILTHNSCKRFWTWIVIWNLLITNIGSYHQVSPWFLFLHILTKKNIHFNLLKKFWIKKSYLKIIITIKYDACNTCSAFERISKHIHINNNNNKRKIETSEVTWERVKTKKLSKFIKTQREREREIKR